MHHTKQIRISDRDTIRRRVNEFTGKKINIVLTNQTAMVAELKRVEGQRLVVKNLRLKTVQIPFSDIAEIYVDVID
jgi:ribosome maturation factor RimP